MRTASVRVVLALTSLTLLPRIASSQQRPERTLPAFQSESAVDQYIALHTPVPATPAELPASNEAYAATCPDSTGNIQPAVIRGRISSDAGESISGANAYVTEASAQAATDTDGRYRLVIPGRCLAQLRSWAVRVRAIGFRPDSRLVQLQAGDSLIADFVLATDVNRLDEIVVTGTVEGASITNVQTAGVDEGGIVKLHGDYLVMLRRGRLFTVRVGANDLRPITAIDAFGPGINPRFAWYDELIIAGDKVVVVGYSYERGGTELGIFRIDRFGGLSHLGTYQLRSNDYYSSRNYASRLIGSKLVFYTPLYIGRSGTPRLPAMRHWNPASGGGAFTEIVTAQRIYRPWTDWKPDDYAAMHTVTSCDLSLPELACEATVMVGPPGRVFYVSANAVYVWMSEWSRRNATSPRDPSVLARLPLDGGAPTAIGVNGSPVDQFSFLESADGFVNVLVRARANGDAMWHPERSRGDVALLRLPIDSLGDGSGSVPTTFYRSLPGIEGYSFTNRFVGDFLLYGRGSGWRTPRDSAVALYATRWRGGEVSALRLDHAADRIEVMGQDAVVIGADARDLHFSGIRLARRPSINQRYTMVDAAQGETRSHGFFYRVDGRDEGVIGLPVAGGGRAAWRQLVEGSVGILYLQNGNQRFEPLGLLKSEVKGNQDDGCKASCVDWYGNARPIFLGGRVFALMGYEIVEGRIGEGRIRETRRINYAPTAMSAMAR